MKVKGWSNFQHFKNRTPPWIKLYRDLLDDPEWHDLDDKSAKVLVMLWLVASEDKEQDGQLPDIRRLAFRLRMKEEAVSRCLQSLSHYLIQDDIKMISGRYHDATPEERRGEESRVETEREGEEILKSCKKHDRIPYSSIITFLNEEAEKDFKHSTKVARQHIKARWAEGFREDDFRAVISQKVSDWKGDTKMEEYLRPQTLFGTKFESYLQASKEGSGKTKGGLVWNG